jgi:hypothetical protein
LLFYFVVFVGKDVIEITHFPVFWIVYFSLQNVMAYYMTLYIILVSWIWSIGVLKSIVNTGNVALDCQV